MFDFVQEKKWVVQVVLAAIILTFAVWGVGSYKNSGDVESLAEVNGEKIGQQEFERALDQQRQRLREMAGSNFDSALFDQPEVKQSVLDNLVSRSLLISDARESRLMPGDEQIAQVLIGIGAFNKDGKFDKQSYLSALSSRGMNQIDFERGLSQDIALQRLTDAYAQNGYASDTVAEMLIRLNEQQRTVSVANMTADQFSKQAQVNEAEIGAYYDKNPQKFQLPERVNVEYVIFSAESLKSAISVADEEIKKYYEEHIAEFGSQALNEVRAAIMQRVKSQHALDKFAELSEEFNNKVYEQSDSLAPASELVKASVQRGVWLSKGQVATEVWTDKAMQAVFTDDVLINKRNSAAVEIAPNTLLAARAVEYKTASTRPLAEVSAEIRQQLMQQKAAELAAKQGEDTLVKLQRGEKSNIGWKSGLNLTRGQTTGVERELQQAIFRTDINKLPTYVGVKSANGYLLARIDAVKDVETIDENVRSNYIQQIRQLTGEALLMAHLEDIKKNSDITMKDFAAEAKK